MISCRLAVVMYFVAGMLASCIAAEPQSQIRVSIANKDEIWVGQRVTLNVVLLAPGTFASAPSFDLPRLPGVILLPPSGSPVLGTETIDETSYTTQLHELALVSQRQGEIEIPAFTVRFASAPAFNQPAVDQTVTSTPIKFAAKMPPGAEGLTMVVTTSDLTVNQSWNPQPNGELVKLGSAFTRTITAEAGDIPAMLLPAFPNEAPAGLKAYPQPPKVEDHADRGVTRGRRVDAVTFVCESPGTFELPPLALAWWNPEEKKLNRIELPGQKFDVIASTLPTSAQASANFPTTKIHPLWTVATFALIMIAAIAVPFVLLLTHRRPSSADSEAACFEKFERTCRAGDPRATLSTLLAWLDRALPDDPVPTTGSLIARSGDPALANEMWALEKAAYGRGNATGEWSPTRTLQLVEAARVGLRHSTTNRNRAIGALPPLNP